MNAIRRFIPSFILAMVISYFGYHALTGEQGLLNWIVVENEIRGVEDELALAVAERERLESIKARLSNESLDLDYLDERARAVLNVAHPRDFIVEIEPDAYR